MTKIFIQLFAKIILKFPNQNHTAFAPSLSTRRRDPSWPELRNSQLLRILDLLRCTIVRWLLPRTIDTAAELDQHTTKLGGSTLHWDFALILGVLAFVVPVMGRRRVRALLDLHDTTKRDRLSIYASTIAFQWLAAALILWRTIRHNISPAQLGINLNHGYLIITISIVLSSLLLTNQIASVRRIGSDPKAFRSETVQLALKVFPRDGIERLGFLALVITVAVCEEFIYRGFAQCVFQDWSGLLFVGIFGSALLFSFAHLYQGKRGVLSTFVVGLLFSGIRAWSGSLIPTIAAHFVADLSIGLLAPRHIQEALRQRLTHEEYEEKPQIPTAR